MTKIIDLHLRPLHAINYCTTKTMTFYFLFDTVNAESVSYIYADNACHPHPLHISFTPFCGGIGRSAELTKYYTEITMHKKTSLKSKECTHDM